MWWQAVGRWINLPGQISMQIIGYKSSIFESNRVRGLYEKAFTMTNWFIMFFIIAFGHIKSSETVLSALISTVLDLKQKQNLSAPTFQAFSAVLVLVIFLTLAIPLAAILYSVVIGVATRGLTWLWGDLVTKSVAEPQNFGDYLYDTFYRLGKVYAHIRVVIFYVITNVMLSAHLLSTFSPSEEVPPLHPSPNYVASIQLANIIVWSLIILIFLPLVIAFVRSLLKKRTLHS